jgi:hypothetical protein
MRFNLYITLCAFHSMYFILCITFCAFHFLYYNFCISVYLFHTLSFILCIYSVHFILCISFYAFHFLHFLHFIICIYAYYTTHCYKVKISYCHYCTMFARPPQTDRVPRSSLTMRKVIRRRGEMRGRIGGGKKTINLVATAFASQPVCNATRAVHALHSDQF